ncbi:MAG: hypothetical protein MRY57_03795 [Candidatus Pacebacteria bacterium]|nr:hypothetical protein [Candidatus Paceibacterota bacterium]
MKNKEIILRLKKEIINKPNVKKSLIVLQHMKDVEVLLRDLFQKVPLEFKERIQEYFSFMPNAEPGKVHVLSMLLGIKLYEHRFAGKKMKDMIPHLETLNQIFKNLIKFQGNGNPLIEIEYLYQERQNQLWYLG